MKFLDSFSLKILAMIFMVLDHLYTFIPGTFPIWFGYLGKLAAPVFFYFIVEGFFHTRSRKKYLIRLSIFGAFMIPIDMLLGINNNIFLSLAAGVLLMSAVEWTKKTKKYSLGILACIGSAGLAMITESSIYGLGMVLIFYFLRNKRVLMSIVYVLASLIMVLTSVGDPQFYDMIFLFDYQWMMAGSIILILMYNGKRGINNKFSKYLFYIFYPVHLIIINVVAKFLV